MATSSADPSSVFDRAMEAHALHSGLGLDLNQLAEQREFHRAEAKKAEGVILELFDTQDD